MKIKIEGRIVGVFQDDTGHFARFQPDSGAHEVDIPINPPEFHGLIFRPATLTVELK